MKYLTLLAATTATMFAQGPAINSGQSKAENQRSITPTYIWGFDANPSGDDGAETGVFNFSFLTDGTGGQFWDLNGNGIQDVVEPNWSSGGSSFQSSVTQSTDPVTGKTTWTHDDSDVATPVVSWRTPCIRQGGTGNNDPIGSNLPGISGDVFLGPDTTWHHNGITWIQESGATGGGTDSGGFTLTDINPNTSTSTTSSVELVHTGSDGTADTAVVIDKHFTIAESVSLGVTRTRTRTQLFPYLSNQPDITHNVIVWNGLLIQDDGTPFPSQDDGTGEVAPRAVYENESEVLTMNFIATMAPRFRVDLDETLFDRFVDGQITVDGVAVNVAVPNPTFIEEFGVFQLTGQYLIEIYDRNNNLIGTPSWVTYAFTATSRGQSGDVDQANINYPHKRDPSSVTGIIPAGGRVEINTRITALAQQALAVPTEITGAGQYPIKSILVNDAQISFFGSTTDSN